MSVPTVLSVMTLHTNNHSYAYFVRDSHELDYIERDARLLADQPFILEVAATETIVMYEPSENNFMDVYKAMDDGHKEYQEFKKLS